MPVDRCIKNKGPTAILTTTKTTTRKTRNEDGDNDEEKNVGREKRKKEEGKRTRKIKSGGADACYYRCDSQRNKNSSVSAVEER